MKKVTKIKEPKWKKVYSIDIKYETISLADLLETIKSHVPDGTSYDDIKLEFDVQEERGYYDDVMITSEVHIKIKE